jgi:UDP-N-acetylglucosamine:LPS N-acetylglucosamine transferase
LEQGNEVIVCCDADQEDFYRTYFPELWYVPHEGYPFKFHGKGNWTLDVLRNYSSLSHHLIEEKRRVKDLVEKFNPDLIISDQRYGFVSKKVKSVVISHQLNLPVSRWNVLAKFWNKRLLSKFDEIWIPDTKEQKYSGILSNGKHKNKHFIGTCSRFSTCENTVSIKDPFTYLGIVSGPSPYNQQLLDLLMDKLSQSNHNSVVIVPPEIYQKAKSSNKITLISSPSHEEFMGLMNESKVIISRSGYSTIMDLIATGNECILIPTPGQSEQLYLAKIHKNNPLWSFKSEADFESMAL